MSLLEPPSDLSALEITSRLLVALLSAAVIGWEREIKNRSAGLRTHMLVALGACLFTLLSFDLDPSDPNRVISGIVGGIGFLGAGAIIQSRGKIRGLTTAAGIWVVAAIGVASACGNFLALGIAVGLAFVTLFLIGRFEPRMTDGVTESEED